MNIQNKKFKMGNWTEKEARQILDAKGMLSYEELSEALNRGIPSVRSYCLFLRKCGFGEYLPATWRLGKRTHTIRQLAEKYPDVKLDLTWYENELKNRSKK